MYMIEYWNKERSRYNNVQHTILYSAQKQKIENTEPALNSQKDTLMGELQGIVSICEKTYYLLRSYQNIWRLTQKLRHYISNKITSPFRWLINILFNWLFHDIV